MHYFGHWYLVIGHCAALLRCVLRAIVVIIPVDRNLSLDARAPVTWAYGARLMNKSKLRRQIAWEAARLMYSRQESEYFTAKKKAAQQICKGWVKPADLPSNVEIRDQIQLLARMFEGETPHR